MRYQHCQVGKTEALIWLEIHHFNNMDRAARWGLSSHISEAVPRKVTIFSATHTHIHTNTHTHRAVQRATDRNVRNQKPSVFVFFHFSFYSDRPSAPPPPLYLIGVADPNLAWAFDLKTRTDWCGEERLKSGIFLKWLQNNKCCKSILRKNKNLLNKSRCIVWIPPPQVQMHNVHLLINHTDQ